MKPGRNAKEIHPNLFLAIFAHRILVPNHYINGSSLPLKLHGFLSHRGRELNEESTFNSHVIWKKTEK